MHALSRTSSMTSASGPTLSLSLSPADPSAQTSAIHTLSSAAAETEFRSEVAQSLERAFAEGHAVENAAVELKTLRMASNVPLRRVREAVVGAIVDRVPLVPGDAAAQRAEIAAFVRRWGPLIDKIGGVDPVETVEVLQYHCAAAGPRQGLFAQMLVALYQQDLVDEDDIRMWHRSPAARGEGTGVKPGSALAEGLKKCWDVGAKLLEQLGEDSDEESEEESDDEEEASKPQAKAAAAPAKQESESEEESEDESDDSEENAPSSSKPAPSSSAQRPPQSAASTPAPKPTQAESDSESEDSESEESDTPPAKPASPPAQPSSPAKAAPTPAAAPTATPAAPSAASTPAQSAGTSVPAGAPSAPASQAKVAKAEIESSEESSEGSDEGSEEGESGEEDAGP